MKAIMYAMKVEYQNETYRKVISEEFADKNFDIFLYQRNLREQAKEAQGQTEHFKAYLTDSLSHGGELIDKVLDRSVFNKNSAERQRLKISLMLSLINAIDTQQKLTSKCQIILWKLPKTMNNYVKLLFMEVCTEIKNEIIDCAKSTEISDEVADTVLTSTLFERYNNDYED